MTTKMAMSSEPCIEGNQLGIKVQGDLGDFHVVEEGSESEDDSCDPSRPSNALSTLPRDVLKQSMVPVYGNVSVTKSENVHFGNNTYFNGPVTIKQVIKSKEHYNPGYEHTGDNNDSGKPASPRKPDTDTAIKLVKPLHQQLWLQLSCSAVCIILVGGICAIVSITLLYPTQEDSTSTNFNEDDTNSCVKVEGLFYNNQFIRFLLIILALILLTYIIWYHMLLIWGDSRDKARIYYDKTKPSSMTDKDETKYNLKADPLLIAPTHLRIVSRTDWLAQPVEKPLDKIRLPVPWVIIQHTATETCNSQSECVLKVRLIQMFHVESRGWDDIGYNFLVAGDGSAYFGRGWEFQGAHTLGYNKYSMGIAFIGTFNNDPPPKKQLDACKKLIQRGVELGKIAKDYKLFAHRQLGSTLSPGDKLFDILKEWPHFVKNITNIEDLMPNY